MANTFLAAQGHKMGKSLVEEDKIALAKELLAKAKARKVKLLLPVDLVMAETFAADAKHKVEKVAKLDQNYMALDIGPATSVLYQEALQDAKMVVWNGRWACSRWTLSVKVPKLSLRPWLKAVLSASLRW